MRVEQPQIWFDALQQVVGTVFKPRGHTRVDSMIVNVRNRITWVRVGRVVPVVAGTPDRMLLSRELSVAAQHIGQAEDPRMRPARISQR